jgi:choline dehydrogenase-like flavoprotein
MTESSENKSREADFTSGGDRGGAFDLLIIGSGGAGVAAAVQGAELGAKVGIVEAGILGGTCVNVGCIPSKSLIEAADHYHKARRGFPGIAPSAPSRRGGSTNCTTRRPNVILIRFVSRHVWRR